MYRTDNRNKSDSLKYAREAALNFNFSRLITFLGIYSMWKETKSFFGRFHRNTYAV